MSFVTAGNLRTQDFGGPYNLTLLTTQEAEIKSELPPISALCLVIEQLGTLGDCSIIHVKHSNCFI